MTVSDPSSDIVTGYLDLLRRSSVPPKVAASILSTDFPAHDASRPIVLIFSPHPDDECLIGALPLRLKQELGWQVINVAITLGSQIERRAPRRDELAQACHILNFQCILADRDGFSNVLHATRQNDALAWQKMVERLACIVEHYRPNAVIFPHTHDAHPSHIGTHLLGMDALANQPDHFTCSVVQSEYWHPNPEPNLMIGLGKKDTSTLLLALACHVGENARNPFDVRFPAYLIDNVRRGSERIGGKGGATMNMHFAMLYKIGLWRRGKFIPSALKKMIGEGETMHEAIRFE